MDILNLNNDDFSGKSSARKIDENLYNPGPDQGQNGIYKAIFRYVPYVKDNKLSKYRKYTSKLVNPLTNERLYIDCPSTNGVSSILWSLDKELKKLKESEPSIHEELSKYFSRSYNYYSPVYIKKDPQFPALEGKIKIFPFGYTIDNLIQQQLTPEAEFVSVPKINPFHPIDGKDFVLVVKRKTKSWRDFSSCKFMDQVSPLILTVDGNEIPMTTDPKRVEYVTDFLVNNTPDMTPYLFTPWTDSDYEKVAQLVKAIVPYKQIIENVMADLKDEKMKKLFANSAPINRSQGHTGESLEYTPTNGQITSSPASSLTVDFDEPTTKPTSKKEVETSTAGNDSLDDLLKDL
jgi:hypothetical protein